MPMAAPAGRQRVDIGSMAGGGSSAAPAESAASAKAAAPKKASAAGSIDKAAAIKLGVAIVIIVGSIGWVLYTLGIFEGPPGGGSSQATPLTPEQQAEVDKRLEEQAPPPNMRMQTPPSGAN
jgi:hypothetical protein